MINNQSRSVTFIKTNIEQKSTENTTTLSTRVRNPVRVVWVDFVSAVRPSFVGPVHRDEVLTVRDVGPTTPTDEVGLRSE